ncbi:hypothetical protein ABH935_007505 [Catenulispora sp. GAS73]|uniref:hypothetical protein n=1 Tax=Catenulispora sp. GAS73 TaxID=3156269 RepID=UPI003515C41D
MYVDIARATDTATDTDTDTATDTDTDTDTDTATDTDTDTATNTGSRQRATLRPEPPRGLVHEHRQPPAQHAALNRTASPREAINPCAKP